MYYNVSHKSGTVAHNTPTDSVVSLRVLRFQTVIDMYIFSSTLKQLTLINSDR